MVTASLITINGERETAPWPVGSSIRLHENRLHLAPDAPVAACTAGQWHFAGEPFHALEIESPVYIRFQEGDDSSEAFGPFHPVKIVDSMIVVGHDEAAFAQLTRSGRSWVEFPARRAWQEIVLSERADDL